MKKKIPFINNGNKNIDLIHIINKIIEKIYSLFL